jgi:hypothetical protein
MDTQQYATDYGNQDRGRARENSPGSAMISTGTNAKEQSTAHIISIRFSPEMPSAAVRCHKWIPA